MKLFICFNKYNRFRLAVFAICSIQFNSIAQSSANLVSTALHRIIFEKKDTVFNFYVIKQEAGKVISDDLTYSWYAQDTILQTRGGYDGFVLNGAYAVFYPNKNLKEEGNFVYGLKVGEWKIWYPDGKLKSVFTWKNGKRQGKFVIYDEKAVVIQSGSYKNDLMEGSILETTPDNKTEIKKYKKGQLKIQDSTSTGDEATHDNYNQ